MSDFEVDIELNGVPLSGWCSYSYTPEDPGNLYGHPDSRRPPTPAELDLEELFVTVNDVKYDVSYLLDVPRIYQDLKQQWYDWCEAGNEEGPL